MSIDLKAVSTEATVIREGEKLRVPSRELIPGDLVLICLAVGSPMILWAAVVNRFEPPS